MGDFNEYDAGLLNDFGGGDVGWWQDYIRAELGRAYDFYTDQCSNRIRELEAKLREALAVIEDTENRIPLDQFTSADEIIHNLRTVAQSIEQELKP